jgi:pimeloyl-ACP methyl ester carboxylesterase
MDSSIQSHLQPRKLTRNQDVEVYFAFESDGKAILFIHGYSGDAIGTWADFHRMAQNKDPFRGRDLFFYGYDGLRADVYASAALFRVFLERLMIDTSAMISPDLRPGSERHPAFTYDDLIIVAHSLGAVVARRALLDLTRLKAPWLSKVRLVLFAPAHTGASVTNLAKEVLSGLPGAARVVAPIAKFFSPLIAQLEVNSSVIEALKKETEDYCRAGEGDHLIARRVITAHRDSIVCPDYFVNDPPPFTIQNTDHVTVCKPKLVFRDPLTHLEECL